MSLETPELEVAASTSTNKHIEDVRFYAQVFHLVFPSSP